MGNEFKQLIDRHGDAGAREKFEDIISMALQRKDADAYQVKASQGDGGIDVFRGDINGTPIIYQCKFFVDKLGDSQKDQIRKSYKVALDNYPNFLEWVLCIPKILTQDEHKWWSEFIKKHSEKKIDLMDGNRLVSLLKDTKVYKEYFSSYLDLTNNFVITEGQDISYTTNFVGREDEFCLIKNYIESGEKRIVLSGMGGMGKTTLSCYLFNYYSDKYKSNNFIRIDHIGYLKYKTSLDNTLVSGLISEKTGNLEEDVKIAWNHIKKISESSNVLLIIDNIPTEGDKEIERLYELSAIFIITSRRKEFINFKEIPINCLEYSECEKIFISISQLEVNDADETDLKYIIENLAGNHTLTVELLANIAKRKNYSIRTLKSELKESGFKLSYKKGSEITNIQEEYEILYNISELSQGEKNILEAFSLFDYGALPFEECNEWLNEDAHLNEEDEIFYELYNKGWLHKDKFGYLLHPVFAEFIYEMNRPKMSEHRHLFEKMNNYLIISDDNEFKIKENMLIHINKFAEKIKCETNDENNKLSMLYSNIAKIENNVGSYKKAIKWLKAAENICTEDDIKSQIYLLLGESYTNVSDFKNATIYLNKAYIIILQEEDKDKLVDYFINHGLLFERLAQNNEDRNAAINELEEALEILKINAPNNLVKKATIYNSLGGVYTNMKPAYRKEALENHIEALKIRRKFRDTNVMDLARTYNNIGNIHYYIGKDEKKKKHFWIALKNYKKSLKLRKIVLFNEHPDIARVYGNIGNAYWELGKIGLSIELLERCLKIRIDKLGEECKEVAITYANLANIYYKIKNKKAKKYSDKVIYIYGKIYGEDAGLTKEMKKRFNEIKK